MNQSDAILYVVVPLLTICCCSMQQVTCTPICWLRHMFCCTHQFLLPNNLHPPPIPRVASDCLCEGEHQWLKMVSHCTCGTTTAVPEWTGYFVGIKL